MDATAILPKPAPAAPTNAQNAERETAAEEFAAYLPPEENVRPDPQRKPETRKPVESSSAADASGDAATDDADVCAKPDDATVAMQASLSTPMASVTLRPQNSAIAIDLSGLLSVEPGATTPKTSGAGAAHAGKPGPDSQGPQTVAPATTPIAGDNAPPAPATDNAPAPAQQQQQQTPVAATALPGAQAQTETRPLPKLRAGRSDAVAEVAEVASDAKPAAIAPPQAASAAAKFTSKVETASAVQASAAVGATKEKSTSADAPAPLGDAAPAEHRAHRLNEAAGPQGHRATTPAALVAQHIIRRFDGKSTSIDVRLDPPELGRVQVSLEVSADNKVSAVVAADNPATLSDLVRSARELERALQDAGLDLDGGSLSFDLADRGPDRDNGEKSQGGGGGARADMSRTAAPVASRPFGLESWRGARIDVMV